MSWLAWMATAIVVAIVLLVVGIKKLPAVFLSPEGDESLGKKGMQTGVAAVLYSIYHYVIAMSIALAIVSALVAWGCSFGTILAIMWVINVVNGWMVVRVSDKTGKDMTLMEGNRRVVDAVTDKSESSGALSELYWLVRLVFWDGPGELFIYLRPKVANRKMLKMLFLIAAGLQMVLWTEIYIKGYDSLSQLF